MTDSLIPISTSLSPLATPANAPLLAFLNQYKGSTRRTMERYLSIVVNLADPEPRSDNFKDNLLQFDWRKVDVHFCNRILRLCQDRQPPYSRSTRKTLLIALRGIAKQRRILGQITMEEYQDIKEVGSRARGDNPTKKAKEITPEDLLKMLAACESDENKLLGRRDFALISLLFGSGLRAAEAVALKRSQIDFEGRSLTVTGKGQDQRTVYPVDGVLEALGEWLGQFGLEQTFEESDRPDNQYYIFTAFNSPLAGGGLIRSRLDRPISYSALYWMVRKRALQAGVPVPSPHWFRHSFATETYKQTRDLYGLQHQLGHKSQATTQIYVDGIQKEEAKRRAGASWKLPRSGEKD